MMSSEQPYMLINQNNVMCQIETLYFACDIYLGMVHSHIVELCQSTFVIF